MGVLNIGNLHDAEFAVVKAHVRGFSQRSSHLISPFQLGVFFLGFSFCLFAEFLFFPSVELLADGFFEFRIDIF